MRAGPPHAFERASYQRTRRRRTSHNKGGAALWLRGAEDVAWMLDRRGMVSYAASTSCGLDVACIRHTLPSSRHREFVTYPARATKRPDGDGYGKRGLR